ncbi:hypothetical protein [Moorena sp. SIO4G3]|uniref:hypothetical protein n=1 Tax=Moorena sp. SIO4G3 TaxID=2607821 RepID=UPI00142C2D35|nr:hypothetical protein [Moorena sp. SIO4G3]NEO75392.1 hypothetical protein [Moorena sp. SIO4G3]
MNKNRPITYQQWLRVVIKKMPHLSKQQAVVLGMWSFAIAMTHPQWFIYCGCVFGGNSRATREHNSRKIKAVV